MSTQIQWRRVNDEPFEYAIQQGPHGDEFVKLLDGSCLRRGLDEVQLLRDAVWAAIPWFDDLAHMGSIVDQERRAKTSARLCAAVGAKSEQSAREEGK